MLISQSPLCVFASAFTYAHHTGFDFVREVPKNSERDFRPLYLCVNFLCTNICDKEPIFT